MLQNHSNGKIFFDYLNMFFNESILLHMIKIKNYKYDQFHQRNWLLSNKQLTLS